MSSANKVTAVFSSRLSTEKGASGLREATWYEIASSRLPDTRENENNIVFHTVVFVFPTIWEPGRGWVRETAFNRKSTLYKSENLSKRGKTKVVYTGGGAAQL